VLLTQQRFERLLAFILAVRFYFYDTQLSSLQEKNDKKAPRMYE
jgi:hypothetical protein